MIEKARERIKELLAMAQNPAVMCSFGKDSLLLLYLAREVKPDISIVWFKQSVNKESQRFAEWVIAEWDLTVFSYAPSDKYYLPNGEGLTLVDEYSFGQTSLPVLTDTVEGESCGINLPNVRTPLFDYQFDVTLVGCKLCDEHSILGHYCNDCWELGKTVFYAPLKDWTDDDVLEAIKVLGIPCEEVDDRLRVCTRCLQGTGEVFCPERQAMIPSFQWDKEASLAAFRNHYIPQGSN